ncbi:MAG: tol-pal system-associated acyl-CoA thioesterase [Acidibrevibacterium sp.]|jgi:acyl-CoA thioester hydrolase|uniref:tol-pal system-associated acyl-CoA thioesterase n=1 Tax=Acidibrevibacterium fodinaquatile TaxID=1969806 RepID=UPI001F07FD1D|nr:tol-pal system-associated acyl-CoA thioesterase [Acidibrevibacterium fodinaquatile]MCA7118079.1 tol-pal system-associated acyl-CoA thioesterase [Acidibrevibacterium fodinaquatile]
MFAGKKHRYEVRVYFEDTDAGGIVYHATYLRFAERARSECLRDLGIAHAELVARHGIFFVVRRAKLDYLRPARLDDLLVVETEVLSVGGASASLRQSFYRRGETAALVLLTVALASVGCGDQRPARLPAAWRTPLAALVE